MRRFSIFKPLFISWVGVFVGCLDAQVDDTLDPSRLFVPQDAPIVHVEDLPEFAEAKSQFTTQIDYLAGYADGERIWYWNVNGPNVRFIAPVYYIELPNGELSTPIIDVIPGDTGYTPWWRVHRVPTTERYNNERILSREAIDAGIRAGILDEPVPTEEIVNGPVVLRSLTFDLGNDQTGRAEQIWYRNLAVHWVEFSHRINVELTDRNMLFFPVYVLQRINEGAPLYEFATGVDITGDDKLNDSNNIFSGGLTSERYSPLWFSSLVRTVGDYPSIDTSSAAVGLTAENQFLDSDRSVISDLVVSVTDDESMLINCPIQEIKGQQ